MSPDPAAEWWTVDDVAAYLKIAHLTVIQYHQQGRIPRRDRRSTTLLWRPQRIIEAFPNPPDRRREWRYVARQQGRGPSLGAALADLFGPGSSFPQDVKTHQLAIHGQVTTGGDTRVRGTGRSAPLLVDGSTGNWDRIERGWKGGGLSYEDLEDRFIEDVIYEDAALGEGSGGWAFDGTAYTVVLT